MKLGKRACLVLAALWIAIGIHAIASQNASEAQLRGIQTYIRETWHKLTRSNAQLADAAVDPKFPAPAEGRWPVYVARNEDLSAVERTLRREMPAVDYNKIAVRQLPPDEKQLRQQGLLYLPLPYVVPGGRFNEMYGWDSYFIQVGLLRDNELPLVKDMAANFLYEIHNYGKILNANRTYYLTRSLPPFLTEMVLGVYRRTRDRGWLERAVPSIVDYYRYWTTEPHLTPDTGLSRYYDSGEGPAPEVVSAERAPNGHTHYELVQEYYRTHAVEDYDLSQYYDRQTGNLTALFYKGDRSMRESGFDPSNRFGPFNIDIIHYNPVCLNTLLYIMERDTAEIMTTLGRDSDANVWRKRAEDRAGKINRLMWDSEDGLYYDYNFAGKKMRHYPFLTAFYPLWAGIASRDQAARVVANLNRFERAGGLQTSTNVSGSQWDAPFGWAPLQMIAVQALRRYGYTKDADRITERFLSLVLAEYLQHHSIVEKYDVLRRSMDVSAGIGFGYRSNEIGFGWTNAAFEELYAELPAQQKPMVLRLDWRAALTRTAARQ
ncbi:MAG TPA: trehalase family glycosidase [Bryobacteraceae bacterium]|nr:trehalase family glycosidase [Bryobacteraceae bacterium]